MDIETRLGGPLENPLLSCQSCRDCDIQHAAFMCPESGCPKHTRNGPCIAPILYE